MSRRLRRSLVLTTLLAFLVAISGAAALTGRAAEAPSTTVDGIDVDATTIPELQAFMNSRQLKSVDLTNFYLGRIRQLNPSLNAVITVSPTAHADALAADRARRNGDHRPLLGIPIIVKDNIDTTGMPTTAGSWALAGSTPDDAFIVQQLKAAGAIIIAKANLSEWANFRSGPSSSGWSGIGRQTSMAYVLDRNPCGSSSGSGVVASADLAVAAVGTETDGSIVCPSGANGDVGIKPTLGLWSRAGVVPISSEQDTAGPITRNVTDAAAVLAAIQGVDPNDPAYNWDIYDEFVINAHKHKMAVLFTIYGTPAWASGVPAASLGFRIGAPASGQAMASAGSSSTSTRRTWISAAAAVPPMAAMTGSRARRHGCSTPSGAVASTTSFVISAKKNTIATSFTANPTA